MSSSESALHPEVDLSEETSITSSSQRLTNLLLQMCENNTGIAMLIRIKPCRNVLQAGTIGLDYSDEGSWVTCQNVGI